MLKVKDLDYNMDVRCTFRNYDGNIITESGITLFRKGTLIITSPFTDRYFEIILSSDCEKFEDNILQLSCRQLSGEYKKHIKPPIGLKPKIFHDEQRLKSIDEVIERYIKANEEIPIEWFEERNDLLNILSSNRIDKNIINISDLEYDRFYSYPFKVKE